MKLHIRLNGFSLLEILAVVAIIGILATLSFGPIRSAQIRNRDTKRKADLQLIAQGVEAYYVDRRTVPGTSANCTTIYDSKQGSNWIPNLGPYLTSQVGAAATLPKDPRDPNQAYIYQCFLNDPTKRYRLTATLENKNDKEADASGAYTIER
jgi:prepilin-type N-terminal cleavage/methylation domain-containing protein